ncbi:lipocalin family protein, partial [candidate division KSB1 bacterium]|nr:lipocalin family protein [candidate division KSB1 bacterium]
MGNIEVLKFSSIFEIHYSTLKLTSDNKFESNYNLDSGVETETGTWSTSENVLTIAFDPGGSETFEFSLDGDQYNPDVFPVDPLVGTDEDFRIILEAAHDAGHFNMPYLNVTIWD